MCLPGLRSLCVGLLLVSLDPSLFEAFLVCVRCQDSFYATFSQLCKIHEEYTKLVRTACVKTGYQAVPLHTYIHTYREIVYRGHYDKARYARPNNRREMYDCSNTPFWGFNSPQLVDSYLYNIRLGISRCSMRFC